ncbi:hypothetical protein Tco_0099249 [Tanacetum coccineum]
MIVSANTRRNSKNKVEAHPRNVKSSLNKRNGTVKVNGSASVQNSKKHDNSDYVCINGDDCMSSDNLCVSNSMNDVKFRAKSKKRKSKKEIWKPTGKVFNKMGYIWRPTGRTFTIVGNACPLTRTTTTNEVPSRKPIVLESESPKPVVKLVVSKEHGRIRILSCPNRPISLDCTLLEAQTEIALSLTISSLNSWPTGRICGPDKLIRVHSLKEALYGLKQAPPRVISQSPKGIFINQSKYALESLKKYAFESCDPVDTPMVEKSRLD